MGTYEIISKFLRSYFNEYFILKGLKNAELNFIVSKFISNYFKTKGLVNLEHIPHGIDLIKFQEPSLHAEHRILDNLKFKKHFIVTYTGWVNQYRGLQLMLYSIKAAVAVNKKIIFVIAGADPDVSDEIVEFVKNYQLESNIINYGIVDSSLIPGILHHSDVCLSFLDDLPAFHVSPPQKIFEYMAAGKPIICNKIQTHTAFVEHRKTGIVVDMEVREVADAILELFHNKDLYQELSANASIESRKYDIDKIYGRMVDGIKCCIDDFETVY
jgi:glycosyltransferase involved in cell wall biosynthesis